MYHLENNCQSCTHCILCLLFILRALPELPGEISRKDGSVYNLNLCKILAELCPLLLPTMDERFPVMKGNVEPGFFVRLFVHYDLELFSVKGTALQ